MSKSLLQLTDAEMVEARGWLSDCEWADTPIDIAEMPADVILRAIERHYDGGLHAFIVATGKRQVVTRSEWDAKHRDYKLSADQSMSGMPMMMGYDERGTYLAPVVIVER